MTIQALKIRWLTYGGLGAVLTGGGLCLTLEVSHWKHAGATPAEWITGGTASLCVFMAGLSLIANAVRYRIRIAKSKGLF